MNFDPRRISCLTSVSDIESSIASTVLETSIDTKGGFTPERLSAEIKRSLPLRTSLECDSSTTRSWSE